MFADQGFVYNPIDRMIEIMQLMSQGEQASETARTRIQVLSEFL